jgi:hypothetical protein
MVSRKKLYTIFVYAEIIIGIILIISTFVEIFLFKTLLENNIIKILYVIFLGISGVACVVGGLFSLGILPTLTTIPSLIFMLLLLNDNEFYRSYRPDILLFLSLSLVIGILLIIFYREEEVKIEPEIEELPLSELKSIKKREIEKLNLIGIETVKDLTLEEKNVKEISKLTDIDRYTVRTWIKEAKQIQQELEAYRKEQLKKSYLKLKKKKKKN